MTGPSAQVPLREPLSAGQVEAMDRWLRSIGAEVEGGMGDWTLNIRDGAAIGLSMDLSSACSFWVTLEEPEYDEDEERAAVAAYLGYPPAQWISLDAGCGRAIDERILGCLALRFAEQHSGVIDLGHLVTPAVSMERWLRSAATGSPWFTAEEIRAFVATLPGRVCEIPSASSFDGIGFSHVVDVAFWRAWLQHPDFHMLK